MEVHRYRYQENRPMDTTTETLRTLILDLKGARSFDRLSRDCGGAVSANRLHSITSTQLKNFPDPDSIRGLSRGLNVSITRVVMAAARSLDLPVSSIADPDELVLQGAGALPDESKELLVNMSRQLVAANLRFDAPGMGVSDNDSASKP